MLLVDGLKNIQTYSNMKLLVEMTRLGYQVYNTENGHQ